MTNLILPENGSVQALLTEKQKEFLKRNRNDETPVDFDWANLRRDGQDYTAPQGVAFAWETESGESIIEISENNNFIDALVFRTCEKRITILNLKIAQTYYWRVNDSDVRCFATEDMAPRWIYVGGLTNIRDQGGWKTTDGYRMRQGLIYRGSEMEWRSYHDSDPSKEPHLELTEAGKETMLKQLKVKTDLDLRISAQGYLNETPLGDTVDLKLIPVSPYDEFLVESQKEKVKAIFELLANPKAYPIYYHCWGGADRTGTIAYLLEAYLVVPEKDIIDDYEITSLAYFGKRVRGSDYFVRFETALEKFDPSGTMQSRSEKFLRSCGITEETLQALKTNILEKDS